MIGSDVGRKFRRACACGPRGEDSYSQTEATVQQPLQLACCTIKELGSRFRRLPQWRRHWINDHHPVRNYASGYPVVTVPVSAAAGSRNGHMRSARVATIRVIVRPWCCSAPWTTAPVTVPCGHCAGKPIKRHQAVALLDAAIAVALMVAAATRATESFSLRSLPPGCVQHPSSPLH